MTYAPVAAEIHQAFDVHGYFPPKVAFHGVPGYSRANRINLLFAQLNNLFARFNTGFSANVSSTGTTDTINRSQRDYCVFSIRDVDSSYTSHLHSLLIDPSGLFFGRKRAILTFKTQLRNYWQ
jgi:hypothetical protein